MRIILASLLIVASMYGAAAQFNGCMPGICPSTFGMGFNPGNIPGVAPSCSPGNTNGQIDFSVCSNAVYIGLVV